MSKEPIFWLFKPPLECQRPINRLCVKRHSSMTSWCSKHGVTSSMIVPFCNIYLFFLFRTYPFTTVASINGVPMFASNNHKLYNYIKMSINHTRTLNITHLKSSKNKKHQSHCHKSHNILSQKYIVSFFIKTKLYTMYIFNCTSL